MRFKETVSAGLLRSQTTPFIVALLLVAGCAWLALGLLSRSMGLMSVTMEIALAPFVGMWTLMMVAMMLPSITPLASRYLRIIVSHRLVGVLGFTVGYLSVWVTTGVFAFLLAWFTGRIATTAPKAATVLAAAIFAIGGIYQLTPLKDRCLTGCRVPFALLLRYSSWRGPLRHIQVGMHHGAYCVGCCWSLMVLMLAFGIMNSGAMLILAAVVVIEKGWAQGVLFSRLVGVACCVLAVAVIWLPGLAPGLLFPPASMPMSNL